MNRKPFFRPTTRLLLALFMLMLVSLVGLSVPPLANVANAKPAAAPNPNPTWYVDDPILYRARAEPYDHYAVKDPTIVFSGGRYHMFYTGANASGGWQMLYSSATTLEGFRTAAHIYLSSIGESYFAAPEVFYFEPHSRWYLIYQDGTYGAAYATTTNIADPNSWSGPNSFGISGNLGWDYYVICDTSNCYMYNTPSDGSGRIFRRQTTLANFPTGWSAPTVSITDTFEGLNVYRSLADNTYYLVVEDLKDNRYYELWSSSSAGGPWTKVAEKWAFRGNLVYNGSRWTDNVSHGEFIRAGVNQRLEINDINRVDFLIQGTLQLSCCPYQQIPWDLGIIRNYTSGGSTPTFQPPTNTPTSGTTARFKSYNFQTRYIRHQGYRGRIDANVTPFQDSQFRVVAGLANASAVSLESVNFPGYYLRRRSNGEVWLDQNNNTQTFRNDATWYRRAGLANSSWSSFESFSAAGQYMRHRNYLLYTTTISTATDRSDATFQQE